MHACTDACVRVRMHVRICMVERPAFPAPPSLPPLRVEDTCCVSSAKIVTFLAYEAEESCKTLQELCGGDYTDLRNFVKRRTRVLQLFKIKLSKNQAFSCSNQGLMQRIVNTMRQTLQQLT